MGLAEMFVSSIVSLLVENLAPSALSFIVPKGGIDEKFKEWRKILSRIEAVMEDAEDRQLREVSVQQWLHDVQNLVYEIDDFVDDFATDARSHNQIIAAPESSRPSKLPRFVSGLFSSITTTSIYPPTNLRISEITSSLQELEKTKNDLGLREYVGGKFERTGHLRLSSTSLVDPNLVFGREEDSDVILTWLLENSMNDNYSKVRVISIVGMGGIGKTTMAQSLYNNDQVEGCFRDRAWVCVGEDFDVLKISKVIYEEVYKTCCGFSDLNMVQQQLREKLSKRKFLLVLDDIWNEDYEKWDLLLAPFHGGAPGSTIIVTTRSREVAQIIGSKEIYDLKVLADGDCLSILTQHALQRSNFDGHAEFKEVGEVIANRCKGLPLAAKLLGGLLRTKRSSKQWIEVSTSKIWELRSNGIIAALRLSYHHLPPYLKPLFAYCSLFPKGYEFDKHELILLWMAQGFLKSDSGEQKQMEELGCEYFSELLSRSFFQTSTRDKTRFVMHDLNNDLAQFVAGLTYLRLDDKMASNEKYKVSEEARHVSFISSEYGDSRKFKAFNEARCLRTLLPIQEQSWGRSYLSSMVLNNLLPRLQCLRVVSFTGYHISELPNSIGDLKHMRYLNLSETEITELPLSICDLYNLQALLLKCCRKLVQLPSSIQRLINLRYLNLSGSGITELPQSICDLYNLNTLLLHDCKKLVRLPLSIQKLVNLRHLDDGSTESLKEMAPGIGMLTYLRTLPKFIVDKSNGRKITELKGLHHLQGTLSIIAMENVVNVQDAIDANLSGKKGVRQLEMKWNSNFGDAKLEYEVLDALKPQKGLASLGIELYKGQIFPSWVGDRLFSDMVVVRLVNCKNCVNLPPLGQLSSLKELLIQGMDGVKVVGTEFFGTDSLNIIAFQSLIKLSFIGMDSWEEWSAYPTNGGFPCLQELHMSMCEKLDKVSLQRIPSLGYLKLSCCGETVLRRMAAVGSVKKLVVCGISGLNKLDEGIIRCVGEVENLSVSYCNELRYLWEEEVACQVLEKLKSLTVEECPQLKSLGDEEQLLPRNLERLNMCHCNKLKKMPNWQNNLVSLRQLNIKNCKNLQDNLASTTAFQSDQSSYEFSNIEYIYLERCPSLKWFPTGKKLPTSLKSLYIEDCKNVEEAEEGMSSSLLQSVFFYSLSSLKSLPQGLALLTRICIGSCWGLESIPESSLPPTLISLYISECKNLKYMCATDMQSLTSLQELEICGCENLECYPSGGRWPPNLKTLTMGDVKQPISEWGLATPPTSLHMLKLCGEFPQLATKLPITGTTSLLSLHICGLKNLESLGEDLENLSSLHHLSLNKCPKLRELPETLLPTLSSLHIGRCPLVEERCLKEKGDYWPKMSHIPFLEMGDQ